MRCPEMKEFVKQKESETMKTGSALRLTSEPNGGILNLVL